MSVVVRDGNDKAFEAVFQLNQHNVPNLGSLTLPKLDALVLESSIFSIVEVDETFAGFVIGLLPTAQYDSENFLWFKQRYPQFLYVDRIAILDTYKGKGCGRALYNKVECFCQENGINHIGLEVNTKPLNQPSLDFHQHVGYKIVGHQETNGGSKTVALMIKDINKKI